mgnify:CR=1 FL=1|jgi:hypothetical protein
MFLELLYLYEIYGCIFFLRYGECSESLDELYYCRKLQGPGSVIAPYYFY